MTSDEFREAVRVWVDGYANPGTGMGAGLHVEMWPILTPSAMKMLRRMLEDVDECPLRQLAKWAEGCPGERIDVRLVFRTGGCTVACVCYFDDEQYLQVSCSAPTILEAAENAVKQLKERGEL